MDLGQIIILIIVFIVGYFSGVKSYKIKTRYAADVVPERGWRCPNCGKTHQSYDYVCSCGFDRSIKYNIEENNIESDSSKADAIEEVKKYKELLDEGILTQEEFDAKKKQLLSL